MDIVVIVVAIVAAAVPIVDFDNNHFDRLVYR
jgi:hypothetical protein